jgi:type IV pilus assembly protein PilP
MARCFRIVLLSLLALGLTSGCERGKRDLEQWVQQTLQTPGGEIEPIPPLLTPEIVVYHAYDRRDPFQSRMSRPDEEVADDGSDPTGVRPDPDRRREFLESFPLDALRMVGTIELGGVNFALIRDNENVVHRVSEGNYMGTNHGRVVRVRDDRVELIELYEDARNRWSERRTQVMITGQ